MAMNSINHYVSVVCVKRIHFTAKLIKTSIHLKQSLCFLDITDTLELLFLAKVCCILWIILQVQILMYHISHIKFLECIRITMTTTTKIRKQQLRRSFQLTRKRKQLISSLNYRIMKQSLSTQPTHIWR